MIQTIITLLIFIKNNQFLSDEDVYTQSYPYTLYNDVPDYIYDHKIANYVYTNNKKLCSGYFCSFIPLTNKNNTLNIPINYNGYKKQVSNECSKYNMNYINKINRRCSDIVKNHFKKSFFQKPLTSG